MPLWGNFCVRTNALVLYSREKRGVNTFFYFSCKNEVKKANEKVMCYLCHMTFLLILYFFVKEIVTPLLSIAVISKVNGAFVESLNLKLLKVVFPKLSPTWNKVALLASPPL